MSKKDERVYLCCENSFNKLYALESLIKATKDTCQEREFSAKYYNLPNKDKYILSEERNHYINMLSMALDKVSELKEINDEIENEIQYL